ncbi:MAG: dihydrofolate reductase family protein [Bacteroidia bacterium]|nr:dihydrofolate reductase family protein [Bacteroidia bacterium]
MRKLVLYTALSLDGYLARPNHAIDWLPENDTGEDYGYTAFYDTIGAVVYGRNTYDFMRAQGFYAYEGVPNYLFSSAYSGDLPPNVLHVNQPLAAVVGPLLQQEGKNIWLVGGSGLIREALEAQLLAELHLQTIPVLIGQGISLWLPRSGDVRLVLRSYTAYPDGVVATVYGCVYG